MKRLIVTFTIPLMLCVSVMAQSVGSVSQTTVKGNVTQTTFVWTSGLSNNSVTAAGTVHVSGELLRVVTIPSTVAVPSNAYSVVVNDTAGVDVLGGKGASLSSNSVSSFCPTAIRSVGSVTNAVPYAINDLLTIAVTNCNNRSSGSIIIYTR